MHRMKIGLTAAGLLLVATALFYSSASSERRAASVRDVENSVARAQRLSQHLSRLSGLEFANLAAERARKPTVLAVFDRADETARRQAAFEECEALNASLGQESRKADLLAILDGSGKVLARDLNPNAMYGEDLRAKFPAVDLALKGRAVKDTWSLADRVTEVGVAPINRPDGTTVGALLVGYVLSAKKAQERRDLLGTEVAYFHNGRVHASSFTLADGSGKEDVNKSQALAAVLFSGPNLAQQALSKAAPTEVVEQKIDGVQYAITATPLPGNVADKTSGAVLLAPLGGASGSAGLLILGLGIIGIVVALGAAVMTARRFISPLDQIELGVAEVINGNIDYTFKPVGPDFEGLSNSLNVMLARLLGRDEPNEDEVEEEDAEARRWRAEQMVIEEGDGTPPPNAAALAQESEAAYYPRLYGEYVNQLRSLGRPADGLSVQAFMAKLRLAEAGLRQKWDCRVVRFQMVTVGDQIVFRALRLA